MGGVRSCGRHALLQWQFAIGAAGARVGFSISFSGIVTFKKAEDLRAVAREVPLDKLLIETDCPFLAPIPFRGKRNEPAYVIEVARCLAGLHGKTVEENDGGRA